MADTLSLPPTRTAITHVRAVAAGPWVRLEGASDDRSQYTVEIRAKSPENSSEPERICRRVRWTPAQGPLEARDERRSGGSVWQIELTAGGRSAGRRIDLVRAPGSETNEDLQGATAPLFALACEAWSPNGPTRHRESGFASRMRLDVGAPAQTPELSATQHERIKAAILDATALWVRACRECRIDHLVVIAIDGETYLRSGFGRWIASSANKPTDYTSPAVDLVLRLQLESYMFLQAGAGPSASIKPLEPYVAARSMAEGVARFCAAKSDSSKAPSVADLQQALCRPDDLAPRKAVKIAVELRPNGRTFCGRDPDIIACRADRILTELNVRDFKFRFGEAAGAVGAGAVELDLLPVLVHEMGHWIGLAHLDKGASIMASTAERARCIDEPTVAMLLDNLETDSARPQA